MEGRETRTFLPCPASRALPKHSNGLQVASALCASYIGGSVNMAAVCQATQLADRGLVATAMAADNMAMAAYLACVMAWRLPLAEQQAVERQARSQEAAQLGGAVAVRAESLGAAIAAATGCTAFGYAAAGHLGIGPWALALSAVAAALVGSAVARMVPRGEEVFAGAQVAGEFLMTLFFTTVGASAAAGAITWGEHRWCCSSLGFAR